MNGVPINSARTSIRIAFVDISRNVTWMLNHHIEMEVKLCLNIKNGVCYRGQDVLHGLML
jgi:hypothetical protein